jgi:hypothetical protein
MICLHEFINDFYASAIPSNSSFQAHGVVGISLSGHLSRIFFNFSFYKELWTLIFCTTFMSNMICFHEFIYDFYASAAP